ncbi:saccharopine dehydrogenase [Helicobacter sp. CLO-3]|uniref:saccharopine dehydrogenase family protein n=1 Tax=unclassified Helicobacter TaxID=2593540 RepID=UPI0008059EB7|nr:saccharopine dehydrogenase family protein [Helicobacter sp. CLO-3]OBV28851.1 saccharopine dehydrogenase [Helicobacter sp. CLO-3]OHU81481.1 saccharopine dehydrogenase [Helicobacter sp. CLO-3]
MAVVLQIGAGGVSGVVAHKCAQNREVFSRIVLASRTLSKCKAIADSVRAKGLGEIEIAEVDADNVDSLVALIERVKPLVVVNVALPYQDLSIMEACLKMGVHYLDTANYEHPDSAHFEYKEQWAYDARYKKAGIFGLLGSGFDPGVTNVFCAYAQKHYFDEIHSIDILDCNAGDHGYAFATNFNPEINLREVSSKARYWTREAEALGDKAGSLAFASSMNDAILSPSASQRNPAFSSQSLESRDSDAESNLALNPDLQEDKIYRKFEREEKHFKLDSNTQDLRDEPYAGGTWRDVAPLKLMKEWEYPEVGVKSSYLLYHEELESLVRNIRGLRKIRFFMTFGESYLTHMKCLENVGLLRVDEVAHNGTKIVPIQVLKTLLPDPASLASRTKGQTHIGCYMKGLKDGKERVIYIYNICDHEACYKEVNAQGVSYTTGVPAMIGAKLICEGKWGIGQPKNVAFTQSSQNPHFSDSIDFNAERLKLNSDMPKGGEYQGIDNAVELANMADNNKNHAEAVEMRNCGFGAKGEGSLLDANDRALSEQSAIYRSTATQGAGVWNIEQNDPDPFMAELNKQGLPYVVVEIDSSGASKVLEDGRK